MIFIHHSVNMNSIVFYAIPLVILAIFFNIPTSQNNPVIYSLLSVILVFCAEKIANNEKRKNDIKPKLLAVLYLLGYDFILSFTFGANALAFCIASILYLKLKEKYRKSLVVNLIAKILFVLIFYTIQQIINYFTNDVLNLIITGIQMAIFMLVICVETYLISPRNKNEIYFE